MEEDGIEPIIDVKSPHPEADKYKEVVGKFEQLNFENWVGSGGTPFGKIYVLKTV